MKQYIKSLAVALIAFLSVSASAYAFECSVSKNYSEEKLNITYEGEKNDCISVVVMTSGTTPLSAWENIAEENKTTYTHYFKDGSNHEITASGGYPSNVAFIGEGYSDKNGEFNLEVFLEESGTYDVFVTSANTGETKAIKDIVFTEKGVYSGAVVALNDSAKGDKTGFTAVLSDNLSELGFEQIDLQGNSLSEVASVLYNELKVNPFKEEDFDDNLITYKNCVSAVVLNKKQKKDITEDIKEIIAQDDLYLYFSECVTEDVHKEFFTDKMSGKDIGDISELKKACTEALILSVVKYPNGYMNIKNLFSEAQKILGISSVSDKNSVYNKLAGNSHDSIGELVTAYKKAVSESNGSSGGSGGSGGGSSSSKNSSSGTYIPGRAEQSDALAVNMKFVDLDTVMWAYEAISTLADKNIINGKSEDRFAPNDKITREEFIKLVIGVLNENTAEGTAYFTDVSNDAWYSRYVNKAFEIGIVNGLGDGSFGVGQNITRQDISAILYNALKYKAIKTQMGELRFTDNDNIADYAKEAVSVLSEMGVINGYEDGSFQPRASATRAEAAQLIFKTLNILN